MSRPWVFIVTGAPCTGKTTLARRLAHELVLPLVTKDGIKETLFDTLGWSGRAWSKSLGGASYALLFHFLETLVAAGCSHIVEANFYPADAARFLSIKTEYPFQAFQIYCRAREDVIWERFKERAESGQRHPGHVDDQSYAEFATARWEARIPVLDIGDQVYDLDTTDFSIMDYNRLISAIESARRSTDG